MRLRYGTRQAVRAGLRSLQTSTMASYYFSRTWKITSPSALKGVFVELGFYLLSIFTSILPSLANEEITSRFCISQELNPLPSSIPLRYCVAFLSFMIFGAFI